LAASVNQPLYTIEILRLAASIPHLGELKEAQGRAELRSPTCGSTVSVDVRIDEGGHVVELGQRVEACAFGQASAALMGAHAIGRQAPEVEAALSDFSAWLGGSREDPGDWPGLMALAPARSRRARHGAILLPFRGLLAAIQAASKSEIRPSSMAMDQ
jgi:NifU-like protein involved in Fe-S cluster formation